MTDRVKGLTVILDRDFREDDVEHLVGAIRMLRGVKKVTKEISRFDDYIVRTRTTDDAEEAIRAAFAALRERQASGR